MEEPQPIIPVSSATTGMTKPSIFVGASPKLTFIMGIVVGVAAVSFVGFVLAVVFGLAGQGGGKLSWGGGGQADTASTPSPSAQQPDQPAGPPAKVDIKVKDTDYVRGTKNAPVTLVEYSDLECPFCKRFHPATLQLLQEYAGKVQMVFRHFPLSFHANAQKEAEAAECVGKLGGASKFYAFVDKIFERTTSNGTGFALDKLGPLAREVGVAQSKFQSCLDSGEFAAKVQADIQEGSQYGVGGTPTTFVNGTTVEGAVSYEQLKAAVDQALK
ncbi:MAG: thioredoxin domain-containing protein [Candidatus Kerfeldbacteria bacterium]|nr:thioredoxin domain-containing protein [Candidatus Kerfeldbacteria bacterium]